MENTVPQKIQSTEYYRKYMDKLKAIDEAFSNMIVRKGKNANLVLLLMKIILWNSSVCKYILRKKLLMI